MSANPALLVAQIAMEDLTTGDLAAIILCESFGGDPKKLACYAKAEPLYAGQNRLHDIVFDAVNAELNRRNRDGAK